MKQKYKFIYIVYILLGLGLGLWEVFKPVWLLEKGIAIEKLGITFFIALILAAIISMLFGKTVMKKGLRTCIQIALLGRIVTFLLMLFSQNETIMIVLCCADLLINTLIIQWMYPLLAQIKISNILFGLKDNLYDLAGNIGTIIAGIIIGIALYQITSYQICIIFCMFLFCLCYLLLFKIENKCILIEKNNLSKEVLKIKSTKDYIKYSASRRLQLYLILGFLMVILTKNLGLEKSFAGIAWAILQTICNFIGIFVSFKSNQINRVKFFKIANISSIIVLLLAGVTSNTTLAFVAILWIDILSDFYSPMIDAPLTNEIPQNLQLHFANMKHIISYIGKGIAYIISGFLINYDYRLIFIISVFFLVYQNIVGTRALKNCQNTNVYGKEK